MSNTVIESEALLDEESIPLANYKTKARKLSFAWLLQGVLFLLNLGLLTYQKVSLHCEPTYGDISECKKLKRFYIHCIANGPAPAASAIHLEEKYFEDGGGEFTVTPFIGKPTSDLIHNWTTLRKCEFGHPGLSNFLFYSDENIAVSEEFMEGLSRKENGIRLPDGSGYLATIQVYHDLHCVVRVFKPLPNRKLTIKQEQIHRWMYQGEYYPEGLSEKEHHDQFNHIEHCLELLRQSLMCNADMSIITLRWGHSQATPLANWTFPHTCKSWDAIENWASQRQVERIFEPDWLKHPTLGSGEFCYFWLIN